MRLLSPFSMMAICWSITVLVAALTLSHLHVFDLVPVFMDREDLTLSAFTHVGAAWLMVAFLAYAVGDLVAQMSLPFTPAPSLKPPLNLTAMSRITFRVNLVLIGVTLIWFMDTVLDVGPARFAQTLLDNTQAARALLLDNKLFTGMRLFYASLPATGCLALAILTIGSSNLSRKARRRCQITLLLNTAALLLLPIVLSQRLLLLQFLLSAYLVSCLIKGRVVGLPYLLLGALAFFATWIAREALTNPTIDRAPLDIGLQKMAFYFVNDLWNAFAPLQQEIPHSFGMYSLNGLMFLTFSETFFQAELAGRLEDLEHVLGGGTFPFLTAVFVDFGAIFGALMLCVCGVAFRLCFHLAKRSIGWAVVYAQLAAGLLFSSHSIYFTHQNFLFSLGVVWVIICLSRPRRVRRATGFGRPNSQPIFMTVRHKGAIDV